MTSSIQDMTTLTVAVVSALMPFLAFGVIMIFTRHRQKLSAGISLAAITISFLSAVFLAVRSWGMKAPVIFTGQWLISGDIIVPVGVLIDPGSLIMLLIVTIICLLVQIYSFEYMAGDPGFSRYYACMSLFAWAMISLTISPTMLQLYVFWELVGLASYLLIGFWFEKNSASEAGKKAFVMTRLGDVAFLLGLLIVLVNAGNLGILEMNSIEPGKQMSPFLITLSAILIFGGVIGKSAQFPLLTWLPDAMEGPTPVSALLHSATMVAAGVYMFSRLFPFFSLSPTAMTFCLGVGTLSMLLASTMAMVARDIKQVWAYSTISQLGFMLMGLAAGGYFAGFFHLTTHAGFKALLFLCSGVFIHTYHSNDMFEIGRQGGRELKIPMICMTIGAAALSGLPPFSGFFSKEAILGRLADMDNPFWLAAALFGAFLTAYYTFRLIFIILFPKEIQKITHEHQDHKGYWIMAWPLVILASITVFLGFFDLSLEHFLLFGDHYMGEHHSWLLVTALSMASAGVILAWFEFGRKKSSQAGFVEKIPVLKELFEQRWYMDHFYRWFLDNIIYKLISGFCVKNDNQVIDRGLDAFANGTKQASRLSANLHLGMIQYKLITMFTAVFLLALYFFF
ncbi:Putative NADH-quinone oxidoreductase, subunit L [Desulfonema limicola]|uniref:NADH-quinone oxidoreductase, subunit L n=1 Tax=Desulfonema limicola TaxID=45656 RepID=A0A975B7G8_9BACT|nr:NADH-quinone oxidoreductase subunit L [Desulfonema limicola]QTA80208.1 Putative NADH-quinone oxidoreductase, subunit L [Desulfonema limicola]